MSAQTKAIPSGPGAAAMIAAGIGTLTIGILTTAAEFSAGLKTALNFYNPSGPLSGKTSLGIAMWLLSWLLLGNMWKDKNYNLARAFNITLVLIGLGLLLTFPPVFALFAGE